MRLVNLNAMRPHIRTLYARVYGIDENNKDKMHRLEILLQHALDNGPYLKSIVEDGRGGCTRWFYSYSPPEEEKKTDCHVELESVEIKDEEDFEHSDTEDRETTYHHSSQFKKKKKT